MFIKTLGQITIEMKYVVIIGFQWIIIQIAAGAVTLSPINPVGLEHEPLTLTCDSNESTVTGFLWQMSDTDFTTQTRICIVFNNLTSGECYIPNSEWEPDSELYSYACPKQTRHALTIKNITSVVGGVQWKCLTYTPLENSNNVSIAVKVPVQSVDLTSPVQTNVTVNESTHIDFRCEVPRSLPSSTIQWFHDNKTPSKTDDDVQLSQTQESTLDNDDLTFKTTSNMQFAPTRFHNGVKVYCSANNGYGTTHTPDRQILINVKYSSGPPLIQGVANNTNYFAIRSTSQQLTCSVTGGNPLANISWSCYEGKVDNLQVSGQNVSRTVTWTVGTREQLCTCISNQKEIGEQRSSINVKVLYPPDQPKYEVGSATVNATGTIRIVKDTAVDIECNSVSNPSPSVWRWKRFPSAVIQALGKVLSIPNPQLTDAGVYTCEVENTMVPSQGSNVKGIQSSTVNIQLLYPPSVSLIKGQILVEGGNLTVECPVQSGNPNITTIKWTRREGTIPTSLTNKVLKLVDVQRHQSDYYSCTATNRMEPSGCDPEDGSDNSEFYIDVQYKASIESFQESSKQTDVVTLNQGDSLNITCTVDSNPGSTISIRKGSNVLITTQAGPTLIYSEGNSSCETNMGVYHCLGRNEHNSGYVNKTLSIFIRCGPRVPQTVTLINNVTSDTNVSATMSFTVVAYPANIKYVWVKLESEMSSHILGNDSKVTIVKSKDGLQSNITIRNIQKSDFGEYRVTATNTIDSTYEHFYLVPQAKPETPKGFTFSENTVSSVILSWVPGFNGGLPQKFVIRYKRKMDTSYGYIREMEDTGVYNETISDLSTGTEYEANIYAVNSVGSSGNISIFFRTLIQEDPPKPPLGLIGGTVGGTLLLVLVAVALVVIWRIRISKNASNDRDSLTHGQKLTSISKSNKGDNDDDLPDEVENPMYIRSDDVEVTGEGADVVYSQPQKKNAKIKVTNDVYAVVNKKNHQTDTDVYENADDMSSRNTGSTSKVKARPSKTKEKKTNKEGLVYADLVFSNPSKGQKRLVIHGLDDMTEYAEVDLTRKADPLPDSDNEDKNKQDK